MTFGKYKELIWCLRKAAFLHDVKTIIPMMFLSGTSQTKRNQDYLCILLRQTLPTHQNVTKVKNLKKHMDLNRDMSESEKNAIKTVTKYKTYFSRFCNPVYFWYGDLNIQHNLKWLITPG